jgi:aminoglycoside phosphotransferase (APT) family kinase protein
MPASVPGLDVDAITRWSAELGVDADAPLRLSRIGIGKSNITALVEDAAGRRWVLRRPPLGELLDSAHDVLREARILTALAGIPVPTPRVLGLTESAAFTDRPVMLMEHVDGLVINDVDDAGRLSTQLREAIGHGMARALASIHAVDLRATRLDDLASHSPFARRQLRRWTGQWEASRLRPLAIVDELAERLANAVPDQAELTLVHGDFHIRNVIANATTGECRAVLDWELSTLGDPMADVGALVAYWSEPGDPPGAPLAVTTLDGFPSRRELAGTYARASGRSMETLGFWHTLALWKLAIIIEGVRRRAHDRGAPAPYGPETVDWLVHRAESTAAQAGI